MSDMKTIPSRAGFLAARSRGSKALARGLVIQAITRNSDDWRIGLTATKKIGNAVTRNRARRRMRALARDHLAPLAKNGIDYVFIPINRNYYIFLKTHQHFEHQSIITTYYNLFKEYATLLRQKSQLLKAGSIF